MKKLTLYIFLIFTTFTTWSEALKVPPLLEGSNLNLTMQNGNLILPAGTSKTMGFNGDYLGPTIRVSNSDYIKLNIKNDLNEDSTVHWHGLHVPAEFDGGPHQVIKAGATWQPRFTIDQSAATLWYHPHLMGKTAEHVYNGLAGMFYIEDEYSKNLNIPRDYGVNDFPIILQDRRINRNGEFRYNPTMHDYMQGYIGNIMLTNGVVNPELEISHGTYRFRLVNGSNSSIYRIKFSDNRKFTVIASDGGFLPESVERNNIIISPGERYEILVDFKEDTDISLITDVYGGKSFETLHINTSNRKSEYYDHPESFQYEHVAFNKSTDRKRMFRMETQGMNGFTINGRQMSMNRIDFSLPKDSSEIWTVVNVGMGMMMQVPHSFHVHDVQFSVLSFNGRNPDPLLSGPKDTILIMPGDEVVIAMRFEDYTGIYMYHCHFLEHEDIGMMGQFKIE
jgi:FtsP/CotA-like multicopper oxidase with cupredoxin domain